MAEELTMSAPGKAPGTGWNLKVLGGFWLIGPEGTEATNLGTIDRALLAYLALSRQQRHSRAKLATILWPNRTEALHSLSVSLHGLRKALGDKEGMIIVPKSDPLVCRFDAVYVDALLFKSLVSQDGPDALEQAEALYVGDLLEGINVRSDEFNHWLLPERQQLRSLAVDCLCRVMRLREKAGLSGKVFETAWRIVALDELCEEAHRTIMRSHLRAGHRPAALKHAQACEDLFRREMVELEPETRRLLLDVRQASFGMPANTPKLAPATDESLPERSSNDVSGGAATVTQPIDSGNHSSVTRKLAAVLSADVSGYSRLMGADEESTLMTLNLYRGVMTQLIEEHQGRVVGTAGDSVLAEFGSAVQAVRSAVAVQRALQRRNADLDEARRMRFRIGINVGDVMVQGTDLLGDGVNIAARLQQMAEPGSILVSGTVWEQIEGKLSFPCSYVGEHTAKNIVRPVRAYRVAWEQPDMASVSFGGPPATLPLPDKPSIAVLPFTDIGSDPEQEYFADGITEDIITALAKSRWLFVISRNTSFVFKGNPVDIKQIGRELGVRYVLEGSVRKAGNRVRVTAQLIEAASGTHLWSERYDRDLADTFAVQDTITESVVGAIEPELLQVERQRAARRNPENMDAWEHYLRGMWRLYRFNAEDNLEAERHMQRAIELDPTLALGHMGLARVLVVNVWWGWSENLEADRQNAYEAARLAVELDDRDPHAHFTLAWPSLLMREHEMALAEAQKAIDLTPNFAVAYLVLGVIRVFLGRFDQAADPIHRAMRLSPHEPLTFFFYYLLALAQYHQEHYEDAAKLARTGIGFRPFHLLYRALAACCGQLGRREEAQLALEELRRLMPKDDERHWDMTHPYVDPAHRAHFIDGLRKAGWFA